MSWLRSHHLRVFHLLVVVAAAATIVITWPLWQVRESPPLLPLLPLPQVSLGWPLLASIALVALRPGPGLLSYASLLVYGVLTDQTRLQPEFVSLGILFGVGLRSRGGLTLARVHLAVLWFYSGANKLLSAGFMAQENHWMLRSLVTDAPLWLRAVFPACVALGEAGLGIAVLVPRTRRLAAVWALLLHAGILVSLSPLGRNWNQAVWPWNATLALSGFFLILLWRESPLTTLRASGLRVRGLALLLAVYPLGFYIGITDAYLSHNLYSFNVPRGFICTPGEPRCRRINTRRELRVPIPPIHRLLQDSFDRTCKPGDTLIIREYRRLFQGEPRDRIRALCPDPAAPGGS